MKKISVLLTILLSNTILKVHAKMIKPVVGILPFIVPNGIKDELEADAEYISGNLSKWIEIFSTRWIPINPLSPSFTDDVKELNGIILMGEGQNEDQSDLIPDYIRKVKAIIDYAREINKTSYFPIIGIGFGARLLISALTDNRIAITKFPLKNEMLEFKFTNENSFFNDIFPDKRQFEGVRYPNLDNYFIDLSSFEKNLPDKNDFTVIAKIAIGKPEISEALGFFEYKKLPIIGLMSDFQCVQFTNQLLQLHDQFDFETHAEVGYLLSQFVSKVMRKREISVNQKFVIDHKVDWKYFSSKKLNAQFQEIYIKHK